MPIYWSFLILAYFLLFFTYKKTRYVGFCNQEEMYYVPKALVFIPVFYIALFSSFRDLVLDTYFYIDDFNTMPTVWEKAKVYIDSTSSVAFHYVMAIFKIFVSENHYAWLIFMVFCSIVPLFHFYRKHSCNFAFTFFLFIASTSFSWLLNGARQFIAVCVLIGFVDWYLKGDKKHKIAYIAIAIAMAMIHSSAWFAIPLIVLCSRSKVLGKRILMIMVCAAIGTSFIGDVMNMASEIMNKEYDLSESNGSSVLRLLISAVPLILVLFKLKQVKKDATPLIAFAINMSAVGVCFFFASTFSNGILVGRMPIYFTMYNFILIPWLFKRYYNNGIILAACVFCYTFFFYYQMCIAWHGLMYVSYALGLRFGY